MSQPIPPSAMAWWDLFQVFFYVGLAAGGTVVGFMFYFVYKYRYMRQPEATIEYTMPKPSRVREAIIFASISAVILFGLAVVSFRLTTQIQYPPTVSEALVIHVTAFQWDFRFTYPNGFTTLGECRVPAGKPVIFNVTSSDVFHNFGLPEFKLKIDAIPGVYNLLWIVAPEPAGGNSTTYQIKCYELCGAGHPYMVASLIDMAPDQFEQWYNQTSAGLMKMGG